MSDSNDASDPMEFFRKMWNPMSFPLPGIFQPTMDADEVERKITELRAVENWLKVNLNMLQMTIQTLEMQKSALQAMKDSAGGSASRP